MISKIPRSRQIGDGAEAAQDIALREPIRNAAEEETVMEERLAFHFVHHDPKVRAELSRTALALGHHAEVYADLEEICVHSPKGGVVVVRDEMEQGGVKDSITTLEGCGIWLPLVAMGEAPPTACVVDAVKAGALDYLVLPLSSERLSTLLKSIGESAHAHLVTQRRAIQARERVNRLSAREREVLDGLAAGNSTKMIARDLQISPRTIDIYRANMMAKLGANNAAEAVRILLEADH